MNVAAVYINTHKYDFDQAKICIASIRYWYPEIPVYLIKDISNGNFSTYIARKSWGVQELNCERKKLGWGFGKLEPLFLDTKHAFLVLDADTVLTGPVLDMVRNEPAEFIVDDEVQPPEKVNTLYYNVELLKGVDNNFIFPGYNFNTGQWFGTSGIISRNDFEPVISWIEPPAAKFPHIIFQGEQGHLNYILQKKAQAHTVQVARKKIMIWPDAGLADFMDIRKIAEHEAAYPFIIHWAGMKFGSIDAYPRADLLKFYRNYFYTRSGFVQKNTDRVLANYLPLERRIKLKLKR